MEYNNYVLKNGNVFYQGKVQKLDLEISNGKIIQIAKSISHTRNIDCSNKLISPSFVDVHVHAREPGFEHKETFVTLERAALKGGFCDVVAMPNLNPVPNDAETLKMINDKIAKDTMINIAQVAAISKDRLSQELNDFKAIKTQTNFVSDDGSGVSDDILMVQAIKQAKANDLQVLIHAENMAYVNGGSVSVSDFAKRNHLNEINPKAEELMTRRDLILNQGIDAKLHFCHVSTKRAADDILALGKAHTTFEVAPHHLVLSTDDLKMDPNYKMNPPLRSKSDVDALVDYFANGKVNIIATDHAPHADFEKNKPLNEAAFGIIGLELCFPLLYTKLVKTNKVPLVNLINAMSINPGKLMNLDTQIQLNKHANLAIIDLDKQEVFDKSKIGSKSYNSPFLNQKFYGFINATIYKGEILYYDNTKF